MSKKLLMNNYSENDEIILCENYSPNGQPFYLWQDKMIDWIKYELYINVDISKITGTVWRNILTISSTDITSWNGTARIHLYATSNELRFQPINNGHDHYATADFLLSNYNQQEMQIVINKNGAYLEGNLVLSDYPLFWKNTINILKTSNITIGSAMPNDLNICTYNKVSLRKYQERR